ncbi:ASCH domain-containing protein [Sporomusa sp.]|uniref:ASCH domain-containing protein n=1 Tax=Sporomusa sp. TaxID=2078658 RepID=UPI002C062AB5|nr:ASCH domain-containing protein [Sporomusa sp.]HWR09518.1 ASCH domain-containing protein [Sporomusa sp.]
MRALNFYSSNYHSQLVCRRKICTIRLGDKTNKYSEGDIVWVTVGKRFSQKKRIFTAAIDRVLVKPISQLTLHDLQGENPDLTSIDELLVFLQSIYNKTLTNSDIVTVVYFSEVIE